MHQLLQWIGGIFYLLQKIFLSFSERAKNRGEDELAQKWRVASWVVYLIGLVPWVIIFIAWRNWIAASVEASGAPSMVLGLVNSFRGTTKDPPEWLDRLSLVCVPIGIVCSVWDFGGLNTFNQSLEFALAVGFIFGTRGLAFERASGYLWYVLMHVACAWLMWIQGYPWLFVQQVVSLVFIADAYIMSQKRKKVSV